ncbi:hypothetical protein P0082_04535 [Candidatus Haliotispira prima]|uniref:Uncharacterized protein n=1 Tax=Candidatus Haliotispira prima TaxID=3034016 RepID=A0ABY8MLS9_9SPIO|nr:hypothetical protein P0082_04535 [Candidatus Haliotispira prima]
MKDRDKILTDVGKNSTISNIQYPISNIQYPISFNFIIIKNGNDSQNHPFFSQRI